MRPNETENGGFDYQKGDHELIAALAAGKTYEEAAKVAGVSRATVARRMQEAAFRREVERVRVEMFESAIGQLSGIASEAVQTLRKLLGGKTPPTVRLGAAKAILDVALKERDAAALEDLLREVEELKAWRQAYESGKPQAGPRPLAK